MLDLPELLSVRPPPNPLLPGWFRAQRLDGKTVGTSVGTSVGSSVGTSGVMAFCAAHHRGLKLEN